MDHLIVFNGVICLRRTIFLKLLLKGLGLLAIHEEFLLHDIVVLCLHFLFLLLHTLSGVYLIRDLLLEAVVSFHESINLIIEFFLLGPLLLFCLLDLLIVGALK